MEGNKKPKVTRQLSGPRPRGLAGSGARAIIPAPRGLTCGLGDGPAWRNRKSGAPRPWTTEQSLRRSRGRPASLLTALAAPTLGKPAGRPRTRPRQREAANRLNGAGAAKCLTRDKKPWNTHPFGPGTPLPLGAPGAPLSPSILGSVAATSAAASTPAAIFSASGLCVREQAVQRCACALT